MTYQEAFKESEFIRRGYWQGKFMHKGQDGLKVSHYPGSSYTPNQEDLKAEDWVVFDFGNGVIV